MEYDNFITVLLKYSKISTERVDFVANMIAQILHDFKSNEVIRSMSNVKLSGFCLGSHYIE